MYSVETENKNGRLVSRVCGFSADTEIDMIGPGANLRIRFAIGKSTVTAVIPAPDAETLANGILDCLRKAYDPL